MLSLGGLGLGCGSDAVPYANEGLLGTSPSSFFSECKRPAAIQRHSWSSFVPSTSGLPTKTRSPSWGHSRWQAKASPVTVSARPSSALCRRPQSKNGSRDGRRTHTRRCDAMRTRVCAGWYQPLKLGPFGYKVIRHVQHLHRSHPPAATTPRSLTKRAARRGRGQTCKFLSFSMPLSLSI